MRIGYKSRYMYTENLSVSIDLVFPERCYCDVLNAFSWWEISRALEQPLTKLAQLILASGKVRPDKLLSPPIRMWGPGPPSHTGWDQNFEALKISFRLRGYSITFGQPQFNVKVVFHRASRSIASTSETTKSHYTTIFLRRLTTGA
jgi:hypothetical protein